MRNHQASAATGVATGRRQHVGWLGARWDGPGVRAVSCATARSTASIRSSRSQGSSRHATAPLALARATTARSAKPGQCDHRSGPVSSPLQPLGPTRLEHRDYPDGQHPARETTWTDHAPGAGERCRFPARRSPWQDSPLERRHRRGCDTIRLHRRPPRRGRPGHSPPVGAVGVHPARRASRPGRTSAAVASEMIASKSPDDRSSSS